MEKKERKQMKVGDKYVKTVVTIGNVDFEFVAYINDSVNPQAPQFKGKNIAHWVNVKKEKPQPTL